HAMLERDAPLVEPLADAPKLVVTVMPADGRRHDIREEALRERLFAVPRLGHFQQSLGRRRIERLDLVQVCRWQYAVLRIGQPPPQWELLHWDGGDFEHGRVAPAT